MERRYEIEHLWNLAIPHYNRRDGSKWQEDNCPIVRGDYGDLEKAWVKATKNKPEHQRDALMKEIEQALAKQEMLRERQRRGGEFVPQPVLVSRWLNAKRWMNDIELDDEQVAKKQTCICNYPGCTSEVHGPAFKQCANHLYMTA